MRTISPLTNLASLKSLKVLDHPYLFNNFIRNPAGHSEFTQVEEVRQLLDRDQLEELKFEMRYSGFSEYAKLLSALKNAYRLKRLHITINLKSDLVEILNKNIAKDSNLKHLVI